MTEEVVKSYEDHLLPYFCQGKSLSRPAHSPLAFNITIVLVAISQRRLALSRSLLEHSGLK